MMYRQNIAYNAAVQKLSDGYYEHYDTAIFPIYCFF